MTNSNLPIIIAEAGVNHNGSLEMALKLVDAAANAGVDYVKFQTFKSESLVTPDSETATYQKDNCNATSQFEMLKELELTFSDFKKISEYCKEKNIGFLSTPFDPESIDFIASLGVDYMKVPSGEITNLPYLRKIAATFIPVIISTGMCEWEDIKNALQPFLEAGYNKDKIILLHCNTQYPTPMKDVNLLAMVEMRNYFNLPTGYSDHTVGIEVPVAATALNARVIEKHFTLDRSLPGPDHAASLEPHELTDMVKAIRNVKQCLGSATKKITDSERQNLIAARRSIVAAKNIRKGEQFTESNITTKRPGGNLSPMMWDNVIGKTAARDFSPDEPIAI